MAFDVDIGWRYPLSLYEAALDYKSPSEVKIFQIKETLNLPAQFEGMGFTHDTENINTGVRVSAYKTLPSMHEKLMGQMDIAEKVRAVDTKDVARLVIEKHFLKDLKGNLRKFSTQEFRCVNCNEKFRRPPLSGRCSACQGKLLFTISIGSIVKYLESTVALAQKYGLAPYLQQTIMLLQRRIDGVFGREKEKQAGLGTWF
jgi:DNA polymerase II large subunit